MNEELARELIDVVRSSNSFPWETCISALALVGSWIAIALVFQEKYENSRPYAQVSFELLRSSLACVVIRNVGTVPLTIKSLVFNEDFIKQIDERNRGAFINKENLSVNIFPGKMWVLCLGAATHHIMNYDSKILHVDYKYSKINKKRIYKEEIDIDFEQYRYFMVYISEIDELSNVNKEINKNLKKNTQELKEIHTIINNYVTLEDSFIRSIIDNVAED